jgi:uncharacterized membrane protein SpoIIM required for sporulation
MTESQFIEENKQKWKELEEALENKSSDPDQLHALFKKVSGDLSYAQTYFPRRSVRWYLNTLVNGVFDTMRTKKKMNFWASLLNFYSNTLPREIIRNRNAFIASFVVFALSICIGVFSTLQDSNFPISILGNDYMSITEDNIAKGDPMGIYKTDTDIFSFLRITVNNIRVAFLTFVFGFVASIGSLFFLIKNGVMLGVFQTIFYSKGLLVTSFLTIWIHGTIEISSIIIAGAAGIIVGNSILFPKSYTRIESLLIGSLSGVFIMLSTVPLFVIAGFFEGFVTRITDMHPLIKLFIILASLALILFVYVINPYLYYKSGKYDENETSELPFSNKGKSTPSEKTVEATMQDFRHNIEGILFTLLLPMTIVFAISLYFMVQNVVEPDLVLIYETANMFDFKYGSWPMCAFLILAAMYFFSFMHRVKSGKDFGIKAVFVNIGHHFVGLSIAAIIFVLPIYLLNGYYVLITLLVLPFSTSILITDNLINEEPDVPAVTYAIRTTYRLWVDILGTNLGICTLILIGYYGVRNVGDFIFAEMLSWHNIFESPYLQKVYIENLFRFIFMVLAMPFTYFIFSNRVEMIYRSKYSTDLVDAIDNFGLKNTNKSY